MNKIYNNLNSPFRHPSSYKSIGCFDNDSAPIGTSRLQGNSLALWILRSDVRACKQDQWYIQFRIRVQAVFNINDWKFLELGYHAEPLMDSRYPEICGGYKYIL